MASGEYQPGAGNILGDLRDTWNLVLAHQQSILVALPLLTLAISFLVWIARQAWSRAQGGARLAFGLLPVDTDATDEVVLQITNVGDRPAADVRLEWAPRSSMRIAPIPQPFLIPTHKSIHVRITMDLLDYLLREPRAVDARTKCDCALGWIEAAYRNGRRRTRIRTGRSVVPDRTGASLALGELVSLGKLPRRTLRERFPFVNWMDDRTGLTQRREKQAERERQSDLARELEWAWQVIANDGIKAVEANNSSVFVDRLLDELARRGWAWEFSGSCVKATKTWPPSKSFSTRVERETLQDSAAVVLAITITEDE